MLTESGGYEIQTCNFCFTSTDVVDLESFTHDEINQQCNGDPRRRLRLDPDEVNRRAPGGEARTAATSSVWGSSVSSAQVIEHGDCGGNVYCRWGRTGIAAAARRAEIAAAASLLSVG